MDEAAVRRRVAELLTVDGLDHQSARKVFSGALTLLSVVYGPSSPQVKSLEEFERSKQAPMPTFRSAVALGVLESLQGDLEAGLVGSLRAAIAGGVIGDFLGLARQALEAPEEGAKDVASVLAAAAYEDTIRRIGAEFAGISDRRNLEAVLQELKARGILRDTQFSIAQAYLPFRNNALHADWSKIERASVVAVVGFVEQLLLKHFS